MAETILVAEDDEGTAELIKTVLENKDFTLLWARDGEQALQMVRNVKPDLVLLDVIMPKLNGYEVLKGFKENPALRNLPVIFVTVRGETTSKVVGLRMGGYDYITKPFDLEELLARVETVLRIKTEQERLRRSNRRLSELSMTDPLTGLYNRRFLQERLQEEVVRARRYQYPLACILLDIDDFKDVNDAYGHIQGDACLQEIALLLKNANRVVDLVVRYGGEEFLIILPQTDLGGAEVVGERLRQRVEQARLLVKDRNRKITVSLGAAAFGNKNTEEPEELVRRADQALLRAKQLGKNKLVLGSNHC